MPIGKTPNEVWSYILKEDREGQKESRTVFKLRFLTSAERATVNDLRFQSGFGTANTERVLRGLVSWENFNDDHGNAIIFKTQMVGGQELCEQGNLDYLTEDQEFELSQAIKNNSLLTEAEVKNLL